MILRPEQYPKPPRFLHGHNTTVTHAKPKPERNPCECGCKDLAGPGKRFISGHNSTGRKMGEMGRAKLRASKTGELNPQHGKRARNFKGRIRHSDGYILLWTPDHPCASNGRIMEHRLVVEAHLRCWEPSSPFLIRLGDGRLYLKRETEVHHLNGVKDDNRIENLLPMTGSDHAKLHARLKSH